MPHEGVEEHFYRECIEDDEDVVRYGNFVYEIV